MEQQRNQKMVQPQQQEELEEIQHGPFPVEQLQVKNVIEQILFLFSIILEIKTLCIWFFFFQFMKKGFPFLIWSYCQ